MQLFCMSWVLRLKNSRLPVRSQKKFLVTSEKKHHLIERVFDGSGLPRHLINFYKVMCNDGGIEELADIYAEWQKIWDTSHNRVRVECVFAETPSPEKENEIKVEKNVDL